jgi:WD40 repeat protein
VEPDAHGTEPDSACFPIVWPTSHPNPKVDPKRAEEEHRKQPTMHGLYSVALCEVPGLQDLMACASGKGDEQHGSVHIWDTHIGERVMHIDGHKEDVNCVEFHSKQQCLVSGSDDCTAKVWDLQHMGGTELRTLSDHAEGVYGTSFLGKAMETCVATCSFDTLCRVFDMRSQGLVQKLSFHKQAVIGIAFSENKNLLATSGDDGQIALYDIKTWRMREAINTNQVHGDNEVKRLAIDRSGTMLAAPCATGDVLVYDISHPQAKHVATLVGHEECVFGVAWGVEHESGRRVLVSASHDWTSRVWVESDKSDHHQHDHRHR